MQRIAIQIIIILVLVAINVNCVSDSIKEGEILFIAQYTNESGKVIDSAPIYKLDNPNQKYVYVKLDEDADFYPYKDNNLFLLDSMTNRLMIITDNATAADKTSTEIQSFIWNDRTNELPYIENKFTCGNFAKMVHDNAEKEGIRCGYVLIVLADNETTNGFTVHTINAFYATDKNGIIYYDCTGSKKTGEHGRDNFGYFINGNYFIEDKYAAIIVNALRDMRRQKEYKPYLYSPIDLSICIGKVLAKYIIW